LADAYPESADVFALPLEPGTSLSVGLVEEFPTLRLDAPWFLVFSGRSGLTAPFCAALSTPFALAGYSDSFSSLFSFHLLNTFFVASLFSFK